MISIRSIGIVLSLLAFLGAGVLFELQKGNEPKTPGPEQTTASAKDSVFADELSLQQKDKLSLFAGRAVSENLQDQIREADDPSLLPKREPCSGKEETNFSCYDKLYTLIVNEDGIESAFAFLRKEYQNSAYAKAQCHQLTHIIGRAAAQKFSSVFETYGAGDGFCWSGYYHGVMEAVIADIGYANLDDNLNVICSDIAKERKYSFDHYNCVHGLGHGIMAVTQNELFESLEKCNILSEHWDAASCWSGAFMENIMVDNRSHFTAYLKTEDPLYPCNAVDAQYKATCYLMQTSYILKLNNQNFKETFSWCRKADEGFEDICYQSLGRDASGLSVSNAKKAKNICLLGEDFEQQSNCVIGAVKDFISYFHGDKEAKHLCSLFAEDLEQVCTTTATEYVKVL